MNSDGHEIYTIGLFSGDENPTGMYRKKILAVETYKRRCVSGEALDVLPVWG